MPRPSSPQDYRLVALTSHIMKTLERLVLEQLRLMVRPFTDPLQFAYQPRLGAEDGIIYLLNRVYTHLDKPASTESHVLWLLQCFQHHLSSSTGWEDGCHAGWGPHRVLDCRLPDGQTTVHTPTELCVWQGGQQHWGPTGDCPLSLPLHPIHLWLQLLHWVLPPSEVFWWFSNSWLHQEGWWEWIQDCCG